MRSPIPLGIALMAMAVLTGCGANQSLAPDTSTDGSESQEAQVSQAIAENPDLVEDGMFEALDETAVEADAAAGLSVEAPIHPYRYWREIRSIERRFEFAFSDSDSTGHPTRALVTIHKLMRGSFNIVAGDAPVVTADGADTTRVLIRKRLADAAVRKVLLVRVRPEAGETERRPHRWWRVAAVSGVEITSRIPDVRPTPIVSVRLQSGDLDTTLTDPLALRRLHHLIKLDAETEVKLTVTTARPNDVVVLMHRDRRFRLRPNGDNTYSGVWRAPLRVGFHHLGVNALAHGTLFDDEHPYSSQAWILHYVVRGAEPVAALEPLEP